MGHDHERHDQDAAGVAAKAANDAWAVGLDGTLLHWNGTAWAPEDLGTSKDLYAVWAGPSDVVIAGAGGTILALR